MKLTCTRENLYRGLAITSHISTRNVNLPILNNVLLRVDEGGLKLISTNLEIAITCHVRGKVEQQGEYTVPSKLLFDYVNLLPNEQVDIDLIDNALSVKCKRTKTKINGISATEFPLVPPVNGSIKYSVSVNEFKNALSSTLFATATNESRPELSGVYLSFHHEGAGKNKMVVAATDSYRLAETVVNISGGSDEAKEVIVPQRTLAELSRILSIFRDDVEASPSVEIELSDNQIVFSYGSVELTSRTIEGAYPDYRQIIPTNVKTTAVFDRTSFAQAVKTASLFSKTGLFDITVSINPKEGALELFSSDSARGENNASIAGEISGIENTITLNSRYLLDGINALSSEKVILKVIDGANPCILMPENMPGESYQYIIMPIRQ
ncbi:DNA polymerase III subunit beta [Patescibacteria group bacterium]|nr:DNA polymerase III subunit beta [Patescibacteria group bacterium]